MYRKLATVRTFVKAKVLRARAKRQYDSLRTLGRISEVQLRKNRQRGAEGRHFRVRISGRRSSSWTPESDLPTAVVKLYDSRR